MNLEQNSQKEFIITKISTLENISSDLLKKFIKSFEKSIKSEIKTYEDKSGLEDYKMHEYDYTVLLDLYQGTKSTPYKLQILLLFMYSFYKLDGIHYNPVYFPIDRFFKFLKDNDNIHLIIFKLITKN